MIGSRPDFDELRYGGGFDSFVREGIAGSCEAHCLSWTNTPLALRNGAEGDGPINL